MLWFDIMINNTFKFGNYKTMKKSKHLMERIMAVLLSASLVLTIINLTAFAMPFDEESIKIVGIGGLEDTVKEQTLKMGALESDIILPDSLLVTVEKYKLLEKIEANELKETGDKTEKEKIEKEKKEEELEEKKNDVEEEGALPEEGKESTNPEDKTDEQNDSEISEGESVTENEASAAEETQTDPGAQNTSSETGQDTGNASTNESTGTDTSGEESSGNGESEGNSGIEEGANTESGSEDSSDGDNGNEASEGNESTGETAAPDNTDSSTAAENDSARATFTISDFFKAITVYAAEPDPAQNSENEDTSKDAEDESGEDAKGATGDGTSLNSSEEEAGGGTSTEKSETKVNPEKEELEYETEYEDVVLYGVTWELDKESSSFNKFTSDEPGAKFVYVPVVPGSFKIACDYPSITVTIEESLEREMRSAPFSQSCVVDGVYITVFADAGVFPEDARLTAERASDQTRENAEEAVEDQRGGDCNVVASYVFDIKILDGNWREIQPDTSKGKVKVAFSLNEASNDNLDVEIYHIYEDGGTCAQKLDASTEGDTVVAETEGFSAYSLQVTYGVKMYQFTTLPAKLSQIIQEVALTGTPVSAPIPSNATLITVTSDQNGDYDIDCTDNFSSVEWLKVELDDGNTYKILLTQGYKQAGGGSVIYENGFNQPAQDLIDVVLGNGVVASGQVRNGTAYTFGNGTVDVGMSSGIMLDTSGKTPNTTRDPDLAALCQSLNVSYGGDTSVLEFEMQATGTELVFNYAFASDEFDQGPRYNDVFGLFISINGGPYQNIALITRTNGNQVPVTIINLRAGLDGTEMNNGQSTTLGGNHTLFTEKAITLLGNINGISNIFTAKQSVNIGDTIKLKFAICDVGDTSHNSYVFIEAGSVHFNAPDGKNDYPSEEIYNLDPEALFEVSYGGDTHPITSSSAGKIPMEGTDDNGDTYSLLGKTINIVKKGDGTHQDSQPQTLSVAGRPDVIDVDISEGSREVSTTDTSIVLTLDNSDPDRMRQQYRLFDGYGNPISGFDWQNAGDLGGNLYYEGLDPDTDYLIKIYIPATDSYPKSFTTPGVRIRTASTPTPPPEKKTEVVVDAEGGPISSASVKGLDEYTQEQVGQKVIARLNISSKSETAVSPTTVSYVRSDLKARYPSSSEDHIFAEYLDMNVTRQIDDGPIEYIPDVTRVIEIAIGYDLTNKLDPVVFREHSGNITVLDQLQQRPAGGYQDGKVYIEGNTIYIYAQYFSTYVVGYHTYEAPGPGPTPPTPTPTPTPTPPTPTPPPTPGPQSEATTETPSTPVVIEQTPVLEDPVPEPPVIKVVGRAPKTDNLYVEKKVWILLLILELLLIGAVAATNIFFCRISKKEEMQQRWIMALCRVGALLIFITVALVAQINFDYIKSQAMYKDIKYEYVVNQSVSEKAQRIVAQHAPEPEEYWKKKNIDVAKMTEEYPDIVGWILFENEDISYPIMYSGDNYTYLQSAYNGNWAYAGAIFVDGLSSPDFNDRNTLIYGHNMGDKSMFGKLKYYVQDPDYFEDHQYFQIHTANKVYRYQIFAVEEVGDDDDVYYTYGSNPERYDGTLANLIQNSQVEKKIETENLEHMVTLSTCTAADDRRLIICAARVDEEDN